MKAAIPGLALFAFLVAGCDSNTVEAPLPGDITPMVKTSAQGKTLPGTVVPGAAVPAGARSNRPTVEPGTAAATPKGGGGWLWKGYKNPLDRATPKKK